MMIRNLERLRGSGLQRRRRVVSDHCLPFPGTGVFLVERDGCRAHVE
jgi:hypothetical protein